MARIFVAAEPPRSPVLVFYGAAFPTFIESFSPAASLPYLADVARLEMLRVRTYHAADCTGSSAEIIAPALADVARLPDIQVEFHPSLGLIHSQYAVISMWAAHQGITDIAEDDPPQIGRASCRERVCK